MEAMAAPTPPYQVKAVYEYSSPHDDDLSFSNGQLITVTDEEDADWYYGEYTDTAGQKQEGLFPRNFVKMYEPETPPRPSRPSRQKKEPEPSPVIDQEGSFDKPSEPAVPPPELTPATFAPGDIKDVSKPPTQKPSEAQIPKPSGALSGEPPNLKKSDPPIVNDKPPGGSFRDRINAFNKPAAPPVAPKPGGSGSLGGTGFVKKPFVAPPPSKDAYVPPPREAPSQKIYRHDEGSEYAAQSRNVDAAERSTPPQVAVATETSEDQPKPTSLKDRIALLQKQQMEQATRHAEGAQKKDKPKRPVKKRLESQEKAAEHGEEEEDSHNLDRVTRTGTTESRRLGQAGDEYAPDEGPMAPSSVTRDPALVGSPLTTAARGFQSDANDADQSGAGDTEEGEEISTGKDDSDEKPRNVTSMESQRAPQAPSQEPDVGDEEDDADEEEEGEEEEEEVDPEVRRRMEIRERMAKMSGGMGMAGMFGPPGGMPGMPSKKQNSNTSERKTASGESEAAPTARAPPVPTMPMPGLQKVRSPDQDTSKMEVEKEPSEPPRSIVQGRAPGDMPDVEDMEDEPVEPHRRSLERPAPPPASQGGRIYPL